MRSEKLFDSLKGPGFNSPHLHQKMSGNNTYDVAVIGSGIVGLSVALNLQSDNKKVLVIEKEEDVARHQSGRNSGVIHSGIYYKPGSLKSELCIRGRELLLEYAEEKGIDYKLSGKIIADNDITKLKGLEDRARELGLDGVRILNESEMKEREPNLLYKVGLLVPQAGVIDYSVVSESLKEDFINNGGTIVFYEEVTSIYELLDSDGTTVGKKLKTKNSTYVADYLINCAGLYSDSIAKLDGLKPSIKIIPFRGEYYIIRNKDRKLINSMIYPLADPQLPFLGIHLTKTIDGEIEAGPNAVFAFAKEGYTWGTLNLSELIGSISFVGFWRLASRYFGTGIGEMYRSLRRKKFLAEINKFVKDVYLEDLESKNSGVRAQAVDKKGNLIDDFYFLEGSNSLHVINAPSPAATASLAIAEYISSKINSES